MSEQLTISATFSMLAMTLFALFAPNIAVDSIAAHPIAPEIHVAGTGVTASELSYNPERATPILR